MDEIFKTRQATPLDLVDERNLIHQAQDGNRDAQWQLVTQYAGLLQTVAYGVRKRLPKMTTEQQEDLQSDLVLATLEAIQAFDFDKYIRLSQTLPKLLQHVANEMETALTVPRGTLNLWFKIWRKAEGDLRKATELAPTLGMESNTFVGIHQALNAADSEWITVPYAAGKPTADAETHALAHLALSVLNPTERETIEYAYGFRGDPKSDAEIADLVLAPRVTIQKRRDRGLEKMRLALA